MSFFRWQHPCTFKNRDNVAAKDILVWNDSSGPFLIAYASPEWFHFSGGHWAPWTLWRAVPPPSEKEITRAKRAGENDSDRALK